MIHRTTDWKNLLAQSIRDPVELLALLDLPPADPEQMRAAAQLFPLRVPRGFIARMDKGNPDDPLLRQVLPLGAECQRVTGFDTDPVGESGANRGGGVLHKYPGRVLWITTGACAIHCRYCFRRHFPYNETKTTTDQWQSAFDYLAIHPEIDEVILSGGDPFMLTNGHLEPLLTRLDALPQLARLRIHTRLPVVLPERIDTPLLSLLAGRRLSVVVVIHANHPNELDNNVAEALAALRTAGVTLLNQSVLLAGVNDDADTLATLSKRLFDLGVLPYYLHLLDRVAGAAHFLVEDERATALVTALRQRLSGYLVPQLVREQSGKPCKQPVA